MFQNLPVCPTICQYCTGGQVVISNTIYLNFAVNQFFCGPLVSPLSVVALCYENHPVM